MANITKLAVTVWGGGRASATCTHLHTSLWSKTPFICCEAANFKPFLFPFISLLKHVLCLQSPQWWYQPVLLFSENLSPWPAAIFYKLEEWRALAEARRHGSHHCPDGRDRMWAVHRGEGRGPAREDQAPTVSYMAICNMQRSMFLYIFMKISSPTLLRAIVGAWRERRRRRWRRPSTQRGTRSSMWSVCRSTFAKHVY